MFVSSDIYYPPVSKSESYCQSSAAFSRVCSALRQSVLRSPDRNTGVRGSELEQPATRFRRG